MKLLYIIIGVVLVNSVCEATGDDCQAGFWGPECEEPCRCGTNSLRCDQREGCICKTGWRGDHCDQPISACETFRPCRWGHERCVDTSPGRYECVCREGFTRPHDEEHEECVCDENHYGPECEKLCSCGPNSLRCDRERGCICKQGWEGQHCRENVDECLTEEPCRGPHERCVDTPGSYECTCQFGYVYRVYPGSDRRVCVPDPRGTNKDLRPLFTTTTAFPPYDAECPRNHWGMRCDKLCRCSKETMRCDRYRGCVCKPGFTGEYCTDRVRNRTVTPTSKHHTPSAPPQGEVCPRNYWGRHCDKLCRCSEETVRCDRYRGCVCKPGYRGEYCTERGTERSTPPRIPGSPPPTQWPECPRYRWGKDCDKRCMCGEMAVRCDRYTGRCVCRSGWRGQYCTVSITTTTQRPSTSPVYVDYLPKCPRNYWGLICSQLCRCSKETVRCDRTRGCVCKPGYTGQYCTDRINLGPNCPRNYWGSNCDKLCTCSEETARCDRKKGCVCKEGWTGYHCTENINECYESDVCPGDTTCVDLPGSYRCDPNTGKPTTYRPRFRFTASNVPTDLHPQGPGVAVEEAGGWIRVHKSVFYIMLAGSVVGILSTLSLIFCMLCGCSNSKTSKGPSNKDKAIISYATLEEDAAFSIKAKEIQKY